MTKSERIEILEKEIAELKQQLDWQKQLIEFLAGKHRDSAVQPIPYPIIIEPNKPYYESPVWNNEQTTAVPDHIINPIKIMCANSLSVLATS